MCGVWCFDYGSQNMLQDTGKFRKNTHDKYYTRPAIANACVDRILSVWPDSVGDRWIEPSAGAGVFLAAAAQRGITALGLDIAPPDGSTILTADFLAWIPPPTQGQGQGQGQIKPLLFGNPPFGRQGSLAKSFIAHGSSFCDRIALILPRSFMKPSMSRAFPPAFHCCYSEELPEGSFEVNGVVYSVPCVFQLWEKRLTNRIEPLAVEAVGFSYVKSTETHHLIIRRVGVRAGAAVVAGPGAGVSAAPQSHYFIRLEDGLQFLSQTIATQLSAHEFPSNTTGPRSLSKGEINAVLSPLLVA